MTGIIGIGAVMMLAPIGIGLTLYYSYVFSQIGRNDDNES